jgi:hypothetical protein
LKKATTTPKFDVAMISSSFSHGGQTISAIPTKQAQQQLESHIVEYAPPPLYREQRALELSYTPETIMPLPEIPPSE